MVRAQLASASALVFGEGEGGEEERGEEEGAKEEEEEDEDEEEERGNSALRRGTILRRCFDARVSVGEGMEVLGGKRAGILS